MFHRLAFKAAQLADPDRTERFLTALRHATVKDGRPTTHPEEILQVIRKSGIDGAAFLRRLQDGSAEDALRHDLAYGQSLGSLPACLILCGSRALPMQSFQYGDFVHAIEEITKEKL